MANYIKAASVGEIPSGSMIVCLVGGKKIALACVDNTYFAIDDTCTHAHCSLGTEGLLEGKIVTCGCHGAQYDVESGVVLALPATMPVGSYKVKVTGRDIFVYV